MAKIDRVYLIGCGGTGTLVAEPLAKLLTYHKNGTQDITLIDGDRFDTLTRINKNEASLEATGNNIATGNITRQLFDPKYCGFNKAEATKLRLHYMPHIKDVPEYINRDSFSEILLQDSGRDYTNLVISAVDNEATRNEIINTLDEISINFIYLNPGNSLDTAHLSVWSKINNVYTFSNPLLRYENLRRPSDTIPGRCSVMEASTPQLISANFAAAQLVLITVQNILDNVPVYEEVNTNIRTLKTRPLGHPKNILGV